MTRMKKFLVKFLVSRSKKRHDDADDDVVEKFFRKISSFALPRTLNVKFSFLLHLLLDISTQCCEMP